MLTDFSLDTIILYHNDLHYSPISIAHNRLNYSPKPTFVLLKYGIASEGVSESPMFRKSNEIQNLIVGELFLIQSIIYFGAESESIEMEEVATIPCV